jgi:ribonuclease-3
MRAEPAALEASIGYRFSNPEFLTRALTHSSLANETLAQPGAAPGPGDNERLEFLGDSILGFLVAEALMQRHSEWREGELSRFKAHIVSSAHLLGVARRLNLGQYLQLGRSEEMSGGRYKKTLLADAVEAILAAIYLDSGIDSARKFVCAHILDASFDGDEEAGTDVQPAIANFKSALQELAQSMSLPQPRYSVVRERGPEHSKLFTIEVRVGPSLSAQADGRTKKTAAQRAARAVFDRLCGRAAPSDAGALTAIPNPAAPPD